MARTTNLWKGKEDCLRNGAIGEELLPGIPNEVTLCIITGMLSQKDFNILFSVSPAWKQAIQSRLVFHTRVCMHSTETLAVVLKQTFPQQRLPRDSCNAISLYSIRDKSWYTLSPIPGLPQGFPYFCQCVSLDGKIYILGGEDTIGCGSTAVFVLDLAGQGQWKRCAPMLEPRRAFGSAVMDGKIYVFGGTCITKSNCGCEMYNPKYDVWSWKKPMSSFLRHQHEAATLGEEFLVHGGGFCNKSTVPANHRTFNDLQRPLFSEVYHPVKDEWRLIEEFEKNRPSGLVFSAQGKVFVMNMQHGGISVFDIDTQSWTFLQSCSTFHDMEMIAYTVPYAILAVEDELLLRRYEERAMGHLKVNQACFLQSRGFGQKNKDIVWETVKPGYFKLRPFSCGTYSLACSIQL